MPSSASTAHLTIAGLQTTARPGRFDENLELLEANATSARDLGCDLIVTPEMFVSGYTLDEDTLAATDFDGLLARVRTMAGRIGIAMVVGCPEVTPEGIYNSAFCIDDRGETVAVHRKAHLFGALDRDRFRPGDRPVSVFTVHGIRVAVCICYDVEFPETVRAAAMEGADVVVVPTAQMEPFAVVADDVVRVRAWENQIYLAYVNFTGTEGPLSYVGRSSVVGPDAVPLARAEHGQALISATVHRSRVTAAQLRNPYLTDLRDDLFRSTQP